MELRQLIEADAAAYQVLRLQALREAPTAFGASYEETLAQPLAVTTERLREQASVGDSFTLGALDDGRLVGVTTLIRETRIKLRHRATIVAVYVAPATRRRGVGRALLDATIARARRIDGLEQLHLSVVDTNEPARRLYRGLGFTAYGLEPRAIKVGDCYYDEELMVLRLVVS